MENLTILQKRIEEKAKERFLKDFKELSNLIKSNPIGRDLKIDNMYVIHTHCGTIYNAFFNGVNTTEIGEKRTNIEQIRTKLIQKYIQEETDDILLKLGVLSEYINNQ
jgi:hypothetical protein